MPAPVYGDDEDILNALAAYGAPRSVTGGMQLPQQQPLAPQQPFNFMPNGLDQLGQNLGPTFDPGLVPGEQGVPGIAPMVPQDSPYRFGGDFSHAEPYGQNAPAGPMNVGTQGPPPEDTPPIGQRRGSPSTPMNNAFATQDQAAVNAAQAGIDASGAALQAQQAKIGRQAAVMDEGVADAATVNEHYMQARQKARQDSDIETGRWLQDMESMAREEPNHQRYWQNTDSFGKALWLVGMAFSSAALIGEKSAGQRHNPVLEMLKNEIQSDVDSQKVSLQRRVDTMKTKGDLMQRRQGERMTDLKDDFSLLYQRLEGLKQAALLRASAPGPEDTKAAFAAGAQKLSEMQFQIAGKRADESFQAKEKALDRQNTLTTTSMNNNAAMARTMEEIAGREKLAEKTKEGKDPLKDYTSLVPGQTGTGIRVISSKTGQPIGPTPGGAMYIAKGKQAEDVRTFAAQAQSKYTSMERLKKALENDSDLALLFKKDVQFNKDMTELGYVTGAELQPGSKMTDADYQAGLIAAIGANTQTWAGRASIAAGVGPTKEDLAKAMGDSLRNYPKVVNNYLTSQLPGEIYGDDATTDWTPKSLEQAEPKAPTANQQRAGLGIGLDKEVPLSEQDLTPAGAHVVEKAENLRHLSPDDVREGAVNLYREAKGDRQAQGQIMKEGYDRYMEAINAAHQALAKPHTGDEIQKILKVEHGIDMTDEEANRLATISGRADEVLQWYNQQSRNTPLRYMHDDQPGAGVPNIAGQTPAAPQWTPGNSPVPSEPAAPQPTPKASAGIMPRRPSRSGIRPI